MQVSSSQIDAHVGQRMRRLREALGLSQGHLGRQLGLTFSQVQKYEKGANRIGAGRLYIIANLLRVPIQYFFEDLESQPEKAAEPRRSGASPTEIRELEEAFLSIEDPTTRRSLVALVRSLAGPGGDVVGRMDLAAKAGPVAADRAHG
jgi:transcriptional regulator with XRE-family HTH domain